MSNSVFSAEILEKALDELIVLTEEETRLLKIYKIKEATANVERIKDIAHYVEFQRGVLEQNPQIMEGVSQDKKVVLKDLAQKLQVAMNDNNEVLHRVKYTNDEMIKYIVGKVEEKTNAIPSYSKIGKRSSIGRVKDAVAVSLNERI